MTEDKRRRKRTCVAHAVHEMQVRMADPGGTDPDHDLSSDRSRFRDLDEFGFVMSGADLQSAHFAIVRHSSPLAA